MGARIGEQFVIHMGTYNVLVTRKRVKNINFRIGPGGQPRMSIPAHVSRAEAERIAHEHASWFEQALARSDERTTQAPRKWESGETLNVWGASVRLRVVGAHEAGVPCALVGDELVVRDERSAPLRALSVEAWLQQQLIDRLRQLLPSCEEAVGRRATHITVRRMKTRWGSCTTSTGRIRINTALAECPPECTRTVLTHELCHLRVRNHGPEFKALMDLCCPDWRVWQRWLDEHPPSTREFA